VLETIDAGFLASVSRSGGVVQIMFLVLVVLNLVGGFQALGTLLAVGMMMLPAASARLITDDMTLMIAAASVLECSRAMRAHRFLSRRPALGTAHYFGRGSHLSLGPYIRPGRRTSAPIETRTAFGGLNPSDYGDLPWHDYVML